MSVYGFRGPVRDAAAHLLKQGRVVRLADGRLRLDGRPIDARRLVIEANSTGAGIAYPGIACPVDGRGGREGRRHVGG